MILFEQTGHCEDRLKDREEMPDLVVSSLRTLILLSRRFNSIIRLFDKQS